MREEESELDMVRRHVVEGARTVERQRQLTNRLREDGLATAAAEKLLAEFEQSQRMHEDHLARMMAAVVKAPVQKP